MKNKILITVATLGFLSLFNELQSNQSGAPSGKSGSVGDGGSKCSDAGCHAGATNYDTFKAMLGMTDAGIITTNIPGTGYIPGNTYSITVSSAGKDLNTPPVNVSKFGFQLSAENAAGIKKGTFTAGSTTKLAGANITHNGPFTGGTPTWTFNWVAPATGSGTITFTSAMIGANNNSLPSGDGILTATINVSEQASSASEEIITNDFNVFPNPASNNFSLNYYLKSAEKVSIQLINLQGQTLKQISNEQETAGAHQVNFDLHYPSGCYFIKLQAGETHFQKKIVLE